MRRKKYKYRTLLTKKKIPLTYAINLIQHRRIDTSLIIFHTHVRFMSEQERKKEKKNETGHE